MHAICVHRCSATLLSTPELLSTLVTYGNVRGIFVGHDHGNDWCCPLGSAHKDPTHNDSAHKDPVVVCYGRHTGYGGYGR